MTVSRWVPVAGLRAGMSVPLEESVSGWARIVDVDVADGWVMVDYVDADGRRLVGVRELVLPSYRVRETRSAGLVSDLGVSRASDVGSAGPGALLPASDRSRVVHPAGSAQRRVPSLCPHCSAALNGTWSGLDIHLRFECVSLGRRPAPAAGVA